MQSPAPPCTPTRPLWLQRCEEARDRCAFPCSFALCQGTKGEDRLAVDCWSHLGRNCDAVWAVFDGHRGHSVAGYSARLLPGLVRGSPSWLASPGDALRAALVQLHESARNEELKGGSTAVVVAATGSHLWCSCAGDSRAVASMRSGEVRRLSVDHTTSVPSEVERVKASGGRVEWGGIGGLPMTRGIGNFELESDGFACLPDVSCVLRHEVDFVVIASDGLWDVVTDEACCALVRDLGVRACVEGSSADRLAENARRLGSTDDVAVIVIYFPPDGSPYASYGA